MTTGFYGKIPAAGDFVGRGLPRELIARWDRWMDMALPEALATGGGGGLWRFRAAPGVFAAQAVAGVWQLSRDRVGRRFPILIATVDARPAAGDPWYDRAAALLAEARAGGPLDALTAGVAALGRPADGAGEGGIAFWRAEAPEPLRFASASALAAGGLARLFEAGGVPDLPGSEAAEIDPMTLWQQTRGDREAEPEIVPEALDLDDLLDAAGLGSGTDAAASDDALSADGPSGAQGAVSAPTSPEETAAPQDARVSEASGDPLDALIPADADPALPPAGASLLGDAAPVGSSAVPPDGVSSDSAPLDGSAGSAAVPDGAGAASAPPSGPEPDGASASPGDAADPLEGFLSADAAPLSVEIARPSAEAILTGAEPASSLLPDDFLDPAGPQHWAPASPTPVGIPEDDDGAGGGLGSVDPLDALWGDDLPPPADDLPPPDGAASGARTPAAGTPPESAPTVSWEEGDERLDLDDLIDGLGGDGETGAR